MELPKRTDLIADEFVAWALEQPEGRFELSDGEIVALAPERIGHVRANTRALNALAGALAAAGRDCEVIGDGVSLRVDQRTVYGPDAVVRCGPPLPDDEIGVSDPLIVVEVISPSGSRIDSGTKLVSYFQMPRRPPLPHGRRPAPGGRSPSPHRRGRGRFRDPPRGAVALDPPGISVEVRDLLPAA